MRTTRVSLAALFLAVWACEPQAPEACGTVPGQKVNVRDLVRVTVCFTDPDGGRLKLSAETSDSTVAVSPAANDVVEVRGVRVGEATVTVTATDPDGLDARTRFGVTVPNRTPELTTPLPMVTVGIGDSQFVNLAAHFQDPDGHVLAYAVGSVDTSARSLRALRARVSVFPAGRRARRQ